MFYNFYFQTFMQDKVGKFADSCKNLQDSDERFALL